MSIDSDLRTTIPDDLIALDHEELQGRGRRRRIGTRVAGGLGALAIAAGALGVVSTLTAPSLSPIGPGGTTAEQDAAAERKDQQAAEEAARRDAEEAQRQAEEARRAVEESAARALGAAQREAEDRGRAAPDAQVVADLAGLSTERAIDRLAGSLTPVEGGDTEEHLTARSSVVSVGEQPDEWSQVERSLLRGAQHDPTHALLRAEFEEGTTTEALRAVLPSILDGSSTPGEQAFWTVSRPYEGETPPGSWLADDVRDWLGPAPDGSQAASGSGAAATTPQAGPSEQATVTDTMAEGAQEAGDPTTDPTTLDPGGVRSGELLAWIKLWDSTPRVTTDLLDRTVVAFRVEFDGDGVTETLDVQFDPVTGRLTGAEAVIHTGTDAVGDPLVQTEATVIR